MKNNNMAHQKMMLSVLNTIARAGVTNMRDLRQVCSLYSLFLAVLNPWMRDMLREPERLALLGEAGLSMRQAVDEVTDALITRESPFRDGSCRMDLALRQAQRDPEDALSMMYHTIHFICLDMARTARRAG